MVLFLVTSFGNILISQAYLILESMFTLAQDSFSGMGLVSNRIQATEPAEHWKI